MGVATPVTGGDTIKRAKTKVADTDTYQGRVVKMSDVDKVIIKIRFPGSNV